ncbi:MAG: DUF2130 domain-containing protein [Vicinamibacteraceae bacterium]|nr:DUF2130 domain-containing protein [Vicinamibacteraceae bacterium]
MSEPTLKCPKCGCRIELTTALRQEIEATTVARIEAEHAAREEKLRRDHAAALDAARKKADEEARLAAQKAADEARVAARKAADEARLAAQKATTLELAELKERLQERDRQVADLRTAELDLRKRTRALEDKEAQLDLELARKLDAERKAIGAAAEQRAAEAQREKLAQKDLQLDALRRQVEDMQRRIEQGSQQAQGEASELQLEQALAAAFEEDCIAPVGKGIRGADIIQDVRDRSRRACGVIVWERKNTKAWNRCWTTKLKEDTRALKGDVAVLVSQALPEGVETFGFVDGVWVVTPALALPLASVLRASLMDVSQVRRSTAGKHDTKELLYAYFTSTTFRQRIQAIVDSVIQMKTDLDAERRAMERLWKKRGVEIERVVANFASMYGDLQGFAGKALPDVPALALPGEAWDEEVVTEE